MEQQVRGRVWVRQRGSAILPPTSGQSIQQWIYDYGLRDEFAVNTYWIEWYQDCLNPCQRLLREGKMPSDMYDRVKRTGDFATTKLRPAQVNVGELDPTGQQQRSS